MDLFSKRAVKVLLKKYKFFPKKRLGQNFLIDKNVLRKIIKAANLKPKDIILEIGPGIGNLTQELAKRSRKVIAIEKDPKMVEILKETTKELKNAKIIQGDILKIPRCQLPSANYKIVANLPYYIVSPVIRKFLELSELRSPKVMVLMVQKEVAQRICVYPQKPKGRRRVKPPHMNLLSVSVQFFAKPEIISFVSKKSFWPQPKVDSAILKITPRRSALLSASLRFYLFRIVKAGFSHPRKQLINNLSKGLKIDREKIKAWLLKNKIGASQRAEALSLGDWLRLIQTLDSK